MMRLGAAVRRATGAYLISHNTYSSKSYSASCCQCLVPWALLRSILNLRQRGRGSARGHRRHGDGGWSEVTDADMHCWVTDM